MHFTCRSFIGKHSDFNWSQYWENEPDDSALVSQKGHLFGLINLNLDAGSSEINKIGKEIISKINDFYFSQSGDISSSLIATLNHFQNNLSSQFIQSTFILTVIHQKKAYFTCYNTGHVIVQRQDKISQIISGSEFKINESSGQVYPDDKILICTGDFYQNIGFAKLKQSLSQKDIQTIEESFISELYLLNNQPNLAGALIEIHFDDDQDTPYIFSSDSPAVNTSLPHKQSFIKKIFFNKSSYISHHDVSPIIKRKKLGFLIGTILIICLVISIYFGNKKNQEQKVESQYQNYKIELNKKISDSISIKNINLDNALDLAKEANLILEKIQNLKVHTPEVLSLKKQVDSLLIQTGESPTVNSHDIFLDLKTIISNAQFSKIIYTNNEVVLIDTTSGSIESIDTLTQKTKNIIKSPQIKGVSSFAQNNSSVYYVSGNILYSINQGTAQLKIDFNKINHEITDISFWNGVLYALDSSDSKIYKFVPIGSFFDSGTSWLKESANIDPDTTALSINSSIWTISQKGNLRSFTRGLEDKLNFSNSSLPTSGKKIISTVDAGIIIILDKENIIYLYKNSGELIGKYNFSDKKVNDITINEKDNSVYILADDQKIYLLKF